MKKIWRPLASFFAATSEENKEEEEKELNAGEKSEGEESEDSEEEEESAGEKEAKISVSATRYTELMEAENRLLKAEAELQKFGATAEDRAQMMKDSKQLHAWYEAQKSSGAAPEEDAGKSQEGKKSYRDKATQEIIDRKVKK